MEEGDFERGYYLRGRWFMGINNGVREDCILGDFVVSEELGNFFCFF